MKNKAIRYRVLLAKSLVLGTLVVAFICPPARSIDPADDAGVFGSITVARQAREAAKALKNQDYAKAVNAYRSVIDLKNDVPEFYYGLLYAGQKAQSWEQVSKALDTITEQDPAAKKHLSFEIGECYTNTGRFDEAIPMLKLALANTDADRDFLRSKVKALLDMTAKPAPPVVETPEQKAERERREAAEREANKPPAPRPPSDPQKDNIDKTDRGATYLDAFLHSEWIGLVEYRGYDKKENILWSDPPIARYHLVQWLNGPPLNHDMPVRYKFASYDGEPKPDNWKFGPDTMPKIGSRWILFIPQAVPRLGAFDTYKGRFGRQEATDDNYGTILEIIESHHGQ